MLTVLLQKAPGSASSIPPFSFSCTPKSYPSPSPTTSKNTNFCLKPFSDTCHLQVKGQTPNRHSRSSQAAPADLPAHLPHAQHCPLLLESQGPSGLGTFVQPSPHLGFPFHLHLQCHLFEAFHDSCQLASPSSDFSKHPTPTPTKPVLILDKLICLCSYLNSALLTTGGHATLKKIWVPRQIL